MRLLRFYLLFTSIFSIFFIVPMASAHRPDEGNETGVTQIQDPNTSFAYYRELDSNSPVHVYTFEGQAGQFFHAGINIPQIEGLEDYQVSFAILGPGLPKLDNHTQNDQTPTHGELTSVEHKPGLVTTNLPVPDNLSLEQIGGLILENRIGEDFFEPFTQTRYWGRQELDIDLPETGRYYLLVWNPEGLAGKYVLDTGTQEVFSPADLLRFPIWWLNTRLYFEQGLILIGTASLLIMFIAGLVIVRSRKD